MVITNKISTGLPGLDQVVDMLRVGDNAVWQVQSIEDYLQVVRPFVQQAKRDGRRIVYFRFGGHEPLLSQEDVSVIYEVDATMGFERFATEIYNIIEREGGKVFCVFDCLSDLLEFWCSDLMIGNFFRVICPFLFRLGTVTYYALIRGRHTYDSIARIRKTTQLLMDIYSVSGKVYIHPLKVWERYSPTMFFPHLIEEDRAVSITSSAESAALFLGVRQGGRSHDYWETMLEGAYNMLGGDAEECARMKEKIISLMIGRDPRMTELTEKHFTLEDILGIASREIGTGFIGGKSVGMLLARKILQTSGEDILKKHWESHDSFYLGSDIFYTYIVENGWWELRTKQKTPEHYFELAPELCRKLQNGVFPTIIKEQFIEMLEHYGQSPIIVRSSSLLEDNFGNAFAGKYESVFCANQGSLEDRIEAFEQAVRTVYASTMSEVALTYRQNRGLAGRDEQMAILVQRVSGDQFGELFFPHVAGMGNSSNLYVWNKNMDPNAGMLRLVFGLGTRAVDRISGDYARLVTLDNPASGPPVNRGDEMKFSQHRADVLDLHHNKMSEVPLEGLISSDIKTDKELFFSVDYDTVARLKELGRKFDQPPRIADFRKLLTKTDFPVLARRVLDILEEEYGYPVDIEFTANFTVDGDFKFNLLQCRPLQTKGLGAAVKIPEPEKDGIFFAATGNFMGGNIRLPLDYVIFVRAKEYLLLSEREKYTIARLIGTLNQKLKGKNVLLVGPGRWGTTTPSLGVPVHFGELCNMAAICEVSYQKAGLMPELSFGSHFFQDVVESDIFYSAVFEGNENVIFRPEYILKYENQLAQLLPNESHQEEVIHLAQAPGLTLYSDVTSQKLLCFE